MSQLIALVATAVMVDGVRTVIQPGQPLPELGEPAAAELVQTGAASADAAAAAKAEAAEAKPAAKAKSKA